MLAAADRASLVVGQQATPDHDRAVLDDVRIAEVDLAPGHAHRVVGRGVRIAVHPANREVLGA